MADIEITSHVDEVEKEMEEACARALEKCGLVAEGYAKRLCAVDTGLLRNSITHALDGEATSITAYTDNSGEQHGEYSGSAPNEQGDARRAVYIGTNVEYAPYVEMGTSRSKAQPFLKPAVQNHQSMYRKIIESELENA